jgi:type I restriction enzyme S subunit
MMTETKNTKAFYNTEIPRDWEVKELGELFNFKNGINAGKESYGRGVKFINVMEVIYHDYIFPEMIPGTVQISDEQKELYLVKDGDVLFNRTSETVEEIGLSAVFNGNEEVVFGGFVIRGRPIVSEIDNLFKRYCLRSTIVRNQIIKGGQGAVRTNIGQGDLSQIKIPLPPLPEQKAIAQVLSKADAAIHTTEKLITQKELRKKWLMQQLLTGKKRLKGFDGEWKFVRFKEIYSQVKQKAGDEKYLVLSVTKDGIVSQAEYFNKEIASEDTSPYLVVRKGDMAISGLNFWMGSIDVLVKYEVGMVSPAYKVFEIHNPEISATFMKSFVRSEIMLQCLIGSSVVGASIVRRNLDRETLDEWSFRLPSLEEQTSIAQVLQAADQEISLLKAKAERLREQKKGLMQVLLTGKIRLNQDFQDLMMNRIEDTKEKNQANPIIQ